MNRISFSSAQPEAQLAIMRGLMALTDLFELTIYAGGGEIKGIVLRVDGTFSSTGAGVHIQRRDTKYKSETFVTLASITGVSIV